MDGFHIRECRHHHLDFHRLKYVKVFLHIAKVHFDIGLREETENLAEQIVLWQRLNL